MSNQMPWAFIRALVLALFVLACFSAALAQTPSPTPVNPATQPPGVPVNPATQPPGTQVPPATAPQGTIVTPSTPQPTPVDPTMQEPRQPNFPDVQAQPVPPLPDLNRVGVQSSNVVPLSLNDAIRKTLQNNNDIEVSRDDVRFAEQQLRAFEGVYDPILSVTPQVIKNVTPQQSVLGGGGTSATTTSTTYVLSPSLTRQFATGGGTYTLSFANQHTNTSSTFNTINPFYSSNLSLNVAQPLLRNRSIDANRRAIRVQRKRLEQTDSDFRQRTIQIIAQVQAAYWNLVFALRNQQNQLESLKVSHQNMQNIEAQISAGAKAPLDRAQVQTDIATRETNLFLATQQVSQAENTLKQLMLRDPRAPEWSAQLTPTDTPAFDLSPVNLTASLEEAHKNRPELRRLTLQRDINTVDLQYFKNQTLPQVDIVSTVALTGLAGAKAPCTPDPVTGRTCPVVPTNLVGGYGQDISNLFSTKTRNITAGVTISFPIHNRTAEANLAAARIQRNQLEASYRSQDQAVEMDVRNAAQAVDTAQKRVVSARQARESAEQQLAGEQKLYEVGRSTTFLLLQRQNELTSARTSELQAQTDYNKALADLQRATASTLRINNVVVSDPNKP